MHGHGRAALEHFDGICEEGVQSNDVTFVCLLSACSHAGLVGEGMRCYASTITDYRISLKLEHYIYMVDLFGCAGDLEGISGFLFTLGWYCLSLNTRGVGSLLPVPVLIPRHRPTYQTNTGIFRDLKSASTWRKSVCIWRAPYIHQFSS
jgi:hypothetical protein